jgi:hypothetical protein
MRDILEVSQMREEKWGGPDLDDWKMWRVIYEG